MNRILAATSGSLIAVMLLFNGTLAANSNMVFSMIIIHVVGLASVLAIYRVKKETVRLSFEYPWYYYISGFIGIFLVFSNTLCFTELGVTLTLALGLMGQSVFSLIIDRFGLFNRPKKSIQNFEIVGILVISFGLIFII